MWLGCGRLVSWGVGTAYVLVDGFSVFAAAGAYLLVAGTATGWIDGCEVSVGSSSRKPSSSNSKTGAFSSASGKKSSSRSRSHAESLVDGGSPDV